MKMRAWLAAALVAVSLLTGCSEKVPVEEYEKVVDERDNALAELQSAKALYDDATKELEAKKIDIENLEKDNSALEAECKSKDQKIEELTKKSDSAVFVKTTMHDIFDGTDIVWEVIEASETVVISFEFAMDYEDYTLLKDNTDVAASMIVNAVDFSKTMMETFRGWNAVCAIKTSDGAILFVVYNGKTLKI